jgi:hypothetical protein
MEIGSRASVEMVKFTRQQAMTHTRAQNFGYRPINPKKEDAANLNDHFIGGM